MLQLLAVLVVQVNGQPTRVHALPEELVASMRRVAVALRVPIDQARLHHRQRARTQLLLRREQAPASSALAVSDGTCLTLLDLDQ